MQADETPMPPMGPTFNVRQLGAKGDGATDDTAAVQAAIDAGVKARGGHVYFPAGQYRVTKSLVFSGADRFDVTGDGRTSILLHENNEPLLLWKEDAPCRESTVRNMAFFSVKNKKSPDVAVIDCRGGTERSFFSNLLLSSSGAGMGSGIFVEKVMDTTSLDHCVMWGIGGTGVKVARGSEVRIFGGRITGSNPYVGVGQTTAVHLTGGNGGVHIVTTDLIGVHTGLRIGDPGAPSNREVIVTHATFDSSVYGIHQVDNSYLSIAGCWTASSDEAQILIDKDSHGAMVVIAGGTIFNGGAYGRKGAANGMVVRAGSFVLSGLTIRNNKGTGLLVEGEGVRDYAITGCRFAENGTAAELRGDNYTFTGNVFARNKKGLLDLGKDGVVQGNAGV